MHKKEIGKHIRYLRMKNKFRQEDVCRISGITRKTLSRIEAGDTNYTIDILIKILDIFNEGVFISHNDITPNKTISDFIFSIENTLEPLLNDRSRRTNVYGWIYIVNYVGEYSKCKIGLTREDTPESRILNMSSIENYELFYAKLVKNCLKTEADLHHIFKDDRIHGEWFRVSCELAKEKLIEITRNEL